MNLCLNLLRTLNFMSPFLKTIFAPYYLVIYNEIHQVPFVSTHPIYMLILKYQSLFLPTPALTLQTVRFAVTEVDKMSTRNFWELSGKK